MPAAASLVGLASTSNVATYSTAAATPTAGDLLVVFVGLTDQAATDWTLTDDQGGTYTKIRRQVKNGSLDFMEFWVANQIVAAAVATIFTYAHASGAASGCVLNVYRVTAMGRTGAAAVRSQGGQDNQAAAGTPTPALSQAALTGNLTLSAIHNATNPDGVTVPTGWGSGVTRQYLTPTTGSHFVARSSGFTGTSIPWGSTSPSAFSSMAIELDATLVDAGTVAAASQLAAAEAVKALGDGLSASAPAGAEGLGEAGAAATAAVPASAEGLADAGGPTSTAALGAAEAIREAAGLAAAALLAGDAGLADLGALATAALLAGDGAWAEAGDVASRAAPGALEALADVGALAVIAALGGDELLFYDDLLDAGDVVALAALAGAEATADEGGLAALALLAGAQGAAEAGDVASSALAEGLEALRAEGLAVALALLAGDGLVPPVPPRFGPTPSPHGAGGRSRVRAGGRGSVRS